MRLWGPKHDEMDRPLWCLRFGSREHEDARPAGSRFGLPSRPCSVRMYAPYSLSIAYINIALEGATRTHRKQHCLRLGDVNTRPIIDFGVTRYTPEKHQDARDRGTPFGMPCKPCIITTSRAIRQRRPSGAHAQRPAQIRCRGSTADCRFCRKRVACCLLVLRQKSHTGSAQSAYWQLDMPDAHNTPAPTRTHTRRHAQKRMRQISDYARNRYKNRICIAACIRKGCSEKKHATPARPTGDVRALRIKQNQTNVHSDV